MLPSAPSDPIWHALTPIAQQMEALYALIDVCAFYLPWCAGGLVGLATLTLIGAEMTQRMQGETESATSAPVSGSNAACQHARRLG